MKITYDGSHDEVEVPDLAVTCKRGESIEVPDDVGLEMIKQAVWKSSPASRVTAKGKG